MNIPRIIPVLLLKNKGLYKGIKFQNHVYIGDPINTVKIFNDKEADELIILDIENSLNNKKPDVSYVKSIVSEAFMPVAYGGGIQSENDAIDLIKCGVEKIVLNTHAFIQPELISKLAYRIGSQSVVVSIDIKKNFFGKYECYIKSGTQKVKSKLSPIEWAKKFEEFGAGEIMLNSIDRDGTMKGYDISIIKEFTSQLKIPVITCGGASNVNDFKLALENGAHACAAGSMFVFKGTLRGVLISYINMNEMMHVLDDK